MTVADIGVHLLDAADEFFVGAEPGADVLELICAAFDVSPDVLAAEYVSYLDGDPFEGDRDLFLAARRSLALASTPSTPPLLLDTIARRYTAITTIGVDHLAVLTAVVAHPNADPETIDHAAMSPSGRHNMVWRAAARNPNTGPGTAAHLLEHTTDDVTAALVRDRPEPAR